MNTLPDEVIPDILEEHFEELQFLWLERENAIRSPDYLAEEILRIDQRIDAHVDGLVIGGRHALPLLEQGLQADAAEVTFAAARTLLASREDEAAELVLRALGSAKGEALRGLANAVCQAPRGPGVEALIGVCETGPVSAAVVAACVLATQGYFHRPPARLDEFLRHGDPVVRRQAWSIVAVVDGRREESPGMGNSH